MSRGRAVRGMTPGKWVSPFYDTADSEWAREEAARRGVVLSTILTEALSEYRAKHGAKQPAVTRGTTTRREPAPAPSVVMVDDCPHPKARVNKGLCGACGHNVGTKNGGR